VIQIHDVIQESVARVAKETECNIIIRWNERKDEPMMTMNDSEKPRTDAEDRKRFAPRLDPSMIS